MGVLNRLRQVIIAGLVQLFTAKKGLEELVFKNSVETTYDTESVSIDIYNGKRGIAGYTKRGAKGQTVGIDGWKTMNVTPPLVDEGVNITAQDLKIRSFGEDPFKKKSSLQRFYDIVNREVRKLMNRRQRTWNLQIAQLISSGKITIKEGDDNGKTITRTIDFNIPSANKITPTILWNDPDADIFGDFEKAQEAINKSSGLSADWCLLGKTALEGLLKNNEISKLLDNRRIDFGKLTRKNMKNGLVSWGSINGIECYTFRDFYDDKGTLKPYIADNLAIFGSSELETDIVYGSLDALVNNVPTIVEAKQLVTQKVDNDLVALEHRIKSAKLYCLTQAGGISVFTVA